MLVIAALSSVFLSAQLPALTAHELAARVDKHYNQLHSLKAGFTESYDGLGISRNESGALLLVKPGRMKWDYTSPKGKIFLIDGSYAWFYTQGDAQVQRLQTKQLDDMRSPLRFLLGRTKLEKELDNLTLSPAPGGQFTLAGVPHGLEKRVSRITLTVTVDGVITSMEIDETDDAVTRFTFTNEETNPAFPPNTFHFSPPPGVPVVDGLPPV
jgi:outer membrane lipoprotein carrier protein